MPSQLALKDHAEIVLDPSISLKQFPPKLRKLGKHILQTNDKRPVIDICDTLKLNSRSIFTEIWKARKKGNDFYDFINSIADTFLNINQLAVDIATVDGAVSGTHQDRKLYYERIGKLKDSTNINVGSLTIGINVNTIAADPGRDKGIIDVEPFIPNAKQLTGK